MNYLPRIISLIILYSCIVCCDFERVSTDQRSSISANKLRLPDTLLIYNTNMDSLLLDSSEIANHDFLKIYAFIDISCPSCITDIDQWNNIVPMFKKYNVPVLLICHSKGNFEYIKYLFENGQIKKFPYPLYLDVANQLHQRNTFIDKNEAHQAILTDRNNTILAMGNPLLSDEVKGIYVTTITKYAQKN